MIEQRTKLNRSRFLALAPLAALLFLGASSVSAQQSPVPAVQSQAASQPMPVSQADQVAAVEGPQQLHLLVGRSLVITSPTRIKRVSLADPAIAEAIVVSPTQVLVNGKAPGGVSLLLWDDQDQSQAFEVSVDIDVLSLTEKIHQVFPSEPVQVETSKDVVMLSGKISSAAVADKILEVVKNATPKVTSLMQVPAVPSGEILLEVKFAEVQRSYLSEFGVNILSLPNAKNVGTISTQQFSPPTLGQVGGAGGGSSSSSSATPGSAPVAFNLSSLLNLFIFRPDINLGATIADLQNKNILQILAEPNVLTASGKEASFLAGGEFPFPVVQSSGAGTAPTVSIQFKEFGVRLNFTPTITADGLIHLKVNPEVSALDFANALTLQGFVVPALSTRRVTSEMDLRDGQSFAIAGLVDNRVTELLSKVPGIGDIPILGKLFQSKSLSKSKDELLVIVTPHIVQPLDVAAPRPALAFPVPNLSHEIPSTPKAPSSK
jgi:pilus assembly protein CpaC